MTPSEIYRPLQLELITRALGRLRGRVATLFPVVGPQITAWMQALAPGGNPEGYFTHAQAFPVLLLPWWLETSLAGEVDAELQADLIYSSISGYYFIRMIDDQMDAPAPARAGLLPALSLFHHEFESPYRRRFPAGTPFWDFFEAQWARSAEAAIRDTALVDLDRESFQQVSAQKLCASKIPMRAICQQRGARELPPAWDRLVDVLGCFSQLINDFLDWQRDLERDAVTYFLAEGRRRARPGEPMAAWVVREGFSWAVSVLGAYLEQAEQLAEEIGSQEIRTYLGARRDHLETTAAQAADGLVGLARLLAIQERQP